MDRSQFDALSRLVSAKRSRRGALAAIVGAVVLRHDPASVLAKGKSKGRGRVSARAKTKAAAATTPCFPGGTSCTPGKGKNNSGCDFASSSLFIDRDVRGSNLSNTNFTDADAWGADFRGANLSGACFVNATLFGAKLGSSVNLHKSIFCNTVMPDGSVDNSGCDQGTACCPTAPPPLGGTCRGLFKTCSVFAHCCEGLSCTPSLGIIPACQKICSSNAECEQINPELDCAFNPIFCPGHHCCSP